MKYLIPTSAAEHLTLRIKSKLEEKKISGAEVILLERNKDGRLFFPDGEVYTRLSQYSRLEGGEVTILHSGQERPNDGLIELYHLSALLRKKTQPKSLDIFFAYFPYGRQDKEFEEGELVSAEEVYDTLKERYKIDIISIIDAHFAGSSHWDYQKRPFVDVKGSELIKEVISAQFPGVLFSAPDLGSQKRAGLEGTTKKREDSYSVKINDNFSEDLTDEIKKASFIACLDDLSLTGGTMAAFHEWAKSLNSEATLIAGLTHGVKQRGLDRVKEKYNYFYLGNTIDRPEANVDFTELIMESLGILPL